MRHPCIAFIGAGNMASSLIGGLIANRYPTEKIWATNRTEEQLDYLKTTFNINVTEDNRKATQAADIVILAVKPADLKPVIEELKDLLHDEKLFIISIVTGIKSSTIQKWANNERLAVVRAMPNTPALLRSGTTGLFANASVKEEQKESAESILRTVGVTLWFDQEEELNAVTAVSGSGPAYFFLIMETILECAKQMGLDEKQAQLLTINTALGAARMALESGEDIATLRRQVTSPGGTTEQAINVLEAGNIRGLFLKAIEAAKNKASDISKFLD